jgi:hypothetical protein
MPKVTPLFVTPGPLAASWADEGPPAVLSDQSEVDEPAEVERPESGGQPQLVSFDPAIAKAPGSSGHEPGKGPLDHGTVLSVVGDHDRVAPRLSSVDELGIVDSHGPLLSRRAVVQRERKGQVRQWSSNFAEPEAVMETVWPAGQVAVRARWSTRKSSRWKPPGMARGRGMGLMTVSWPAARSPARVAPEP